MDHAKKYTLPPDALAVISGMRVPFAVYQFLNRRVVTIALSQGFCDLFGYSDPARARYDMDHNMYKDTHPDDAARIANEALRFATEGGRYEVVYRTLVPGGGYKVIHALGEHVDMGDGVRLAHVWYMDEGTYTEEPGAHETELSKALNNALHEQSLAKASSYDFLTGLPSMTYFFELAEAAKEAMLHQGIQPVFLYFDMSGMKFYNRKYGFAEGDRMIKAFSKLLAEVFSNESCCHIGGDHFAAFAPEDGVEEKLNRLFAQWQKTKGLKTLPVRVGIYSNRTEDVPISTACDRAKFACDSIRKNYISGFGYYNENLRDDLEKRQYILSSLDRALAENWIRVYYQPIVRAVNGRVCDEEALARWIDPEKGYLPPIDFIPYLEEAGQIYRLDLYVLEQVLGKIKRIREAGLPVVPQSVNLSRSDFDTCDIVEEIRRRVDEAGISRNLITLEITESIFSEDFSFIKEKIGQFRALGFQVWMDDFGSGYSSLNVLQSVTFDLIKFDMSFMTRLNEGSAGKIILTELMKMATALGVDTVCEGVETEEQVHFLQAIGCSKLQGYYYLQPIPEEAILKRYRAGTQIGFENPKESAYFDAMGRINLYDMSFLANRKDNLLRSTFDSLPVSVIEVTPDGKTAQFLRCNESFRAFMQKAFGIDLSLRKDMLSTPETGPGSVFMKKIRECCEDGDSTLIEEKGANGMLIHSLARRISTNPVTGRIALAVAVLSISEPGDGASYAGIARALAADYYNLFYVDINSGDYIEYTSTVGAEEMALERRGTDFFTLARNDSLQRIHPADQEIFLQRFNREPILRTLDKQGSFSLVYRLMDFGAPRYVRMKITRVDTDRDHIIIGISLIDEEMKLQREAYVLRQERVALGRIAALSADYIVLYTVNPETGRYVQYSPSREYRSFGLAERGEDFFSDLRRDAPKAVDPADLETNLKALTKDNILGEIQRNGIFKLRYGLMIDGKSTPVTLRATTVREPDGEKILIGIRLR